MKAGFLAIAVLLAPSLPIHAQSEIPSPRRPPGLLLTSLDAEDRLIAARADIMAFRLDRAEQTFIQLLAEPGNDEAARYHLAAIAFIRGMFEQTEPALDAFFDESDRLEETLDDAPNSPWRSFMEAENYLMRAFAHGRRGDFLRTAVSAKGAYESYLETLRADPTLIDAQTGIGLLKAMIGATPPAYRRFLNMLGYKGTIEEGIRLLDHSAGKARYNADQAAITRDLTKVYMNRGRSSATRNLGKRYETDPNPANGLMYTFALRYARDPERAAVVAAEAAELGEGPEFERVDFLYFHLGSALFTLNRFEEAAEVLRRFVETYRGQSYVATAQVRLGLSLEMLGRRAEAVEIYRSVDAPTSFDIDLAADREAGELIDNPLSENGKALLRGRNAVSADRIEEAVAELESVMTSQAPTQRELTEAAYWLGRAHHASGSLEEASARYEYVRAHPTDEDDRWMPWSTYYLAKITESRGNSEAARELYEEAIDHDGDYPYKKTLHRNARMAMEEL